MFLQTRSGEGNYSYSKEYDGTKDASGASTAFGYGSLAAGDSITSIKKEYADANVGTGKTIHVSTAVIDDGNNGENYTVSYAVNNTGIIIAKGLTIGNVSKVYDGTADATLAVTNLEGVVAGEAEGLTVSATTATYDDKNAATGKTITYTGVMLDGAKAGNYTIAANTTGEGSISKVNVTLTAEDVTKTYDGTTAVTGGTLKVQSGTIFSGDSISGGTFVFADKNAGTGKTVTVSGATISDGNSGNNYNVTYENNTTSTINPKLLTALFADISKVYDGTTNATAGAGTLSGVIAADEGKVNVSASAAYDEKNAGNRTVNYTGVTISGDEAGNYSIATTATGAGTITPKAITATFADITKVYDGSPWIR